MPRAAARVSEKRESLRPYTTLPTYPGEGGGEVLRFTRTRLRDLLEL